MDFYANVDLLDTTVLEVGDVVTWERSRNDILWQDIRDITTAAQGASCQVTPQY